MRDRQPRSEQGLISGYVLELSRESIGLTQEALAERLDVDKHTVQAWESGRRPLSATRVCGFGCWWGDGSGLDTQGGGTWLSFR